MILKTLGSAIILLRLLDVILACSDVTDVQVTLVSTAAASSTTYCQNSIYQGDFEAGARFCCPLWHNLASAVYADRLTVCGFSQDNKVKRCGYYVDGISPNNTVKTSSETGIKCPESSIALQTYCPYHRRPNLGYCCPNLEKKWKIQLMEYRESNDFTGFRCLYTGSVTCNYNGEGKKTTGGSQCSEKASDFVGDICP